MVERGEERVSIPDVCLLLEGTYPYVRGGVSSWVNRLLELHSDLTFALFFLGANQKSASKQFYKIPENVVIFEKAFLFEKPSEEDLKPARLGKQTLGELRDRLAALYLAEGDEVRVKAALDFSIWLEGKGKDVRFGNLLEERVCWDVLREVYERGFYEVSFIDFFWTCRIIHAPLWQMLRALPKVPKAAVYHSISTGYAGAMGAFVARLKGLPYFLSEHGIYTKERMIEITQADWIYEPKNTSFLSGSARLALKNIWIHMFSFLGKMTYDTADPIISLYSGNARLQREFGAAVDRVEIIPNGILPERFAESRARRKEQMPEDPAACRIGFVGRMVPIKDVKTLLRAARMVADVMPQVRFALWGPTDEDEEYFAECQEMIVSLGLGEVVEFCGSGKVEEILVTVDVLVLTSISEALPLVILEAFACGIPAVSTDVGACRELLNGRTEEDKAVGRAGILTGISSPSEVAEALIRMAKSREMREKMGEAGLERVSLFYDEKKIMARYDEIYKTLSARGHELWQA